MRKALLLVLTLSLLLVAGCWDQQIVEDLALLFAIGIDPDPADPQLFFITTTNPTFSESATEDTKKLVAKGHSFADILFNMQRQRELKLVLGQITTIVFSEEAARTGLLQQVMRQVDQERDMNPNANIVIIRGATAREVMYLKPTEDGQVAGYLEGLLDKNFNRGNAPRTTAFYYWFRDATPGVVPVVPVLELTGAGEEKTGLILAGLAALDSSGKLRGTLSDSEAQLFMFLTGNSQRARMSTQLNIDGRLRETSMLIKGVSTDIKTAIEAGKPRIAIKMQMDVDIIDIQWDVDALDAEVEKTVETALARDIQGNALDAVHKTQAWGTDIFGFGQHVRIQNHNWFKGKDWDKEYAESNITLEVKVSIKRLGTLVNPGY